LLVSLASAPHHRIPQVSTIHTLLADDAFGSAWGRLERMAVGWSLGKCQTIVTVSKAVGANLEKNFPYLSDRLRVIYNGVDLTQIRPATMRVFMASTLGLDPGMPVIGVVARLSPEKGVRVLIEAAKSLMSAGVTAQYVIVGDGPERVALEKMVHHLGLTAQVRFMGERYDIPKLISLFDVLVVPSLSEAFSLVALMGGILGVPVVASRSGGIEEVLGEELATFVPSGDAASLAVAVLDVLQQGHKKSNVFEALAEEMAATGHETLFSERAFESPLFAAYDTSDENLPPLDIDNSARGQARRDLIRRFDARRMVEETTALYGDLLGRNDN
jgi:glycosyltransferase involved in cell wall biosynthesis